MLGARRYCYPLTVSDFSSRFLLCCEGQESTRKGLPELSYPFHDKTIAVTQRGRMCMGKKKINLSTVLSGRSVGVPQVEDQGWKVSLMEYDLGYFDLESCRVEPGSNPFGPKILTM